MNLHEFFTFVSLVLTSPTIIACSTIVCIFGKRFIKSVIKLWREGDIEPYLWLLLGISISFFCHFFDNAWWWRAWGLEFVGNEELRDWWFANGVYSNIPFRQGGTIVAAFCHLKSNWHSGVDAWKLRLYNKIIILSTVLSVMYWLVAKSIYS